MKNYIILYEDFNGLEWLWSCMAEDKEHAVEQLQDAERTISGKATPLTISESN